MLEVAKRVQRQKAYQAISVRTPNFTKQNEVLDARNHRFKAVNCTRRSGKSETEVRDHIEIARDYPGSKTVYLALTLDSCAEIAWDVFKSLSDKHNLNLRYNNTKKIVYYPNGSRTRLGGIDCKPREMKKLLGGKLRKVSVDEAGSMVIDMHQLCFQVLMPALTDLRPYSWLTLLGTCENIPNTFFEKVTEGIETTVSWKVFKWTAYENPFMVKQWTEEIQELTASNPKIAEASWFRTHYLNEWVADEEMLILDMKRATFAAWRPSRPVYILGVDLGYNDACAFSVIAYNHDSNATTLLKSYKKPGLDISATAAEIKWLQTQYAITRIEVDGSNKQGVEEMKKRHGLHLESAEKQGKAMFLRLLRDDIITGQLAMSAKREDIKDFLLEADSLIWKDEQKEKEDPRCQNHAVDATLYAWRYAYSYLYRAPVPKIDRNSEEYHDQLIELEAQRMREEREEEEYV
jgi:hypothetical protein